MINRLMINRAMIILIVHQDLLQPPSPSDQAVPNNEEILNASKYEY